MRLLAAAGNAAAYRILRDGNFESASGTIKGDLPLQSMTLIKAVRLPSSTYVSSLAIAQCQIGLGFEGSESSECCRKPTFSVMLDRVSLEERPLHRLAER